MIVWHLEGASSSAVTVREWDHPSRGCSCPWSRVHLSHLRVGKEGIHDRLGLTTPTWTSDPLWWEAHLGSRTLGNTDSGLVKSPFHDNWWFLSTEEITFHLNSPIPQAMASRVSKGTAEGARVGTVCLLQGGSWQRGGLAINVHYYVSRSA